MSSVVTLVDEIQGKVENSAEMLDSKRPGWYLEIDLDTLDIDLPTQCVIGQLYDGKFVGGLKDLGVSLWESSTLAFYALDPDGSVTTHAWKRAIEYRRQRASAA